MKKTVENILKIILLIVSFISFILASIYNTIFYSLISSYFIVFMLCLIHELGHILACSITKGKLIEVNLLYFNFSKNKVVIKEGFPLGGSVKFNSLKHSKLIYLMGPIFTLITFIIFLVLSILTTNILFIVITSISLINVIFVSIPTKGTDIYKIFKK